MKYKSKFQPAILLLLPFVIFLHACGTSQVEEVDPVDLLNQSTETMRSLDGFHYKIDRTGEPAFLDYGETISFRSAEGIYVSPDRVTATVKVITPLLVTEVDIISIEDTQWETNLLTGSWQRVPPEYTFQPQILLNPETGLQAILNDNLYELTLVGLEEIEEMPGLSLYHLSGLIDGEGASRLTYGMIDNETLDVELWIDPDTDEMHRVLVVDPMDEGEEEDTVWKIDFWGFGEVIEITPPAEGG